MADEHSEKRPPDHLQSWLEGLWESDELDTQPISAEQLLDSLREADQLCHVLDGAWNVSPQAEASRAASIQQEQATRTATLERLGRFEIRRPLGKGGMGTVFLAYDPVLQREVALKVPHPNLIVDEKARKRFLREARVAGMMRHPNIIGIHETNESKGTLYLVAEFCDGPTLRTWLKQQTTCQDTTAAARLIANLASAASHAHSKGVIHRDLKPSNVILEPANDNGAQTNEDSFASYVPRVTDFGLAHLQHQDAEAALTRSGLPIGSAEYMAPEQTRGCSDQIGAACDVHALGVMLYELLSGKTPFKRENLMTTLAAIQSEEPRSLRRSNRRVARELEAICFKCLEKEPTKRYASAKQLQLDLENWLAGRPVVARRTPAIIRLSRWARRRPWLATLTCTCILALATTITTLWIHNRTLDHHVKVVENYARQRDEALMAANRRLGELQDVHYVHQMQKAFDAWQRQQYDRVAEIVREFEPNQAIHDKDRRGFEWHLLAAVARPPIETELGRHPDGTTKLAVFPDGQSLASVGRDGRLKVWNTRLERLMLNIEIDAQTVSSVAVSPDGKMIATGVGNRVMLWHADTGESIEPNLTTHVGTVECIAFSPDGHLIASGSRYHSVHVHRLDGELIGEIQDGARHRTLQFTADSQYLIVPSRTENKDSFIRVWRADLSEVAFDFPMPDSPKETGASLAALSRDGSVLATSTEYERVNTTLYDFVSGQRLFDLPCRQSGLKTSDISFDGKHFAGGFENGMVSISSIRSDRQGRRHSGERAFLFRAHEGELADIEFLRDGKLVTCGKDDGTIKLWTLSRAIADSNDLSTAAFTDLDVTSDGRVTIHGKGTTALLDADGSTKWTLDSNPHWLFFVGDGSHVVVGRRDSHKIAMIDADSGTRLRTYRSPKLPLKIAASRTASHFAIAMENAVHVVNSKTLETVARLPFESRSNFVHLAFSPDGARIAASSGRDVILFHIASQAIEHTLSASSPAESFAFSGDMMASGHADGVIRIWDRPSGRLSRSLMASEATVEVLAFAAEGRTLLATGRDETLRLWSIETGSLIGPLRTDGCRRFALTPDESKLYYRTRESTLGVYRLDRD